MSRLSVELPPDLVEKGEAAIRQALGAISADAKVLTESMKAQERQLKSVERGYLMVVSAIDPAVKKQAEYERALKLIEAAGRHNIRSTEELAAATAKVKAHYSGFNEAKAAVDRLAAALDPAVAKTQRLAEQQLILNAALEKGAIDQAQYAVMMKQATDQANRLDSATGKSANALKGLKSSFGKTIAGALAFDAGIKALQDLDNRFHVFGSNGRETIDALREGFEGIRSLDPFKVMAASGKLVGTQVIAVQDAFENMYRVLHGEETLYQKEVRETAELQWNAANARPTIERMGRQKEVEGRVFGDQAELDKQAAAVVAAINSAERSGRLAGKTFENLTNEVQGLLDQYENADLEADSKLKAAADRYSIESSSAERARAEAEQQAEADREEARRAREQTARDFESLLAKTSPLNKALLDLAKAEKAVESAQKQGIGTAKQYKAVLDQARAAVTLALRNGAPAKLDLLPPTETLKAVTAEFEEWEEHWKRGRQLAAGAATEQEKHNTAIAEANDLLEAGLITQTEFERILAKMPDHFEVANDNQRQFNDQLNTALAIATEIGIALGGWETTIGQIIGYAANLVQAYEQVANAQSKAQRAQAGAAVGSNIYGLGQSLGVWDAGGGKSQWGGKKSGNYSDVGAIVGGIVGAYWGPIGSAIGAVIGGAVGSMVKKGADEGIALIKVQLGGLETEIAKGEGGLGGVVGDVGESIEGAVESILAKLGGELEGLPQVSLKIRDDLITVTVGNVKARFKEIDDAVSFAISEILQQGEISGGLSDNVRAALANSAADSVEGLLSDLEFAMALDNVGLDQVEIQIREALSNFRVNLRRAVELGLDTGKVGLSLGLELTDLRNNLLGIQEDPRKALERKSQLFNVQVQMAQAELTLDIAKQEQERLSLQADISALRVEGELAQTHIDIRSKTLEAEGAIVSGEASILGAALAQLAALDKMIEAERAALDNLPDLINGDDIAGALGRLGGGLGRGAAHFNAGVDRFEQIIANLKSALEQMKYDDSVSPYTLGEQVGMAWSDYQATLAKVESGDMDALDHLDEAALLFDRLYKEYTAGGEGQYGSYRSVALAIEAVLEKYSKMSAKEFKNQGVYDEKNHRTAQDQLDETRRHREQNRQQMSKLTETCQAMGEELRRLRSDVNRGDTALRRAA